VLHVSATSIECNTSFACLETLGEVTRGSADHAFSLDRSSLFALGTVLGRSRDSPVNIATKLWAGRPWFDSRQGQE
jgi:hypothetical protein